MPVLKNQKHERFAQAVALGMSAAKAYRQHVARKNTADSSVETDGPALARDSQVSLRIEELRGQNAEKIAAKFDMTRETWLEKLAGIANDAHQTGDFSAATGALTQIGKAADFYAPAKVEVSGSVSIVQEAVESVFGKK
jgi:phage terminase small subunit